MFIDLVHPVHLSLETANNLVPASSFKMLSRPSKKRFVSVSSVRELLSFATSWSLKLIRTMGKSTPDEKFVLRLLWC